MDEAVDAILTILSSSYNVISVGISHIFCYISNINMIPVAGVYST